MTKSRCLRVAGAALLTIGIVSACADQHGMTDEKITAQVQKAIAQNPDLGPPNRISVDTRDHTVYLTGAAYHPLAAENAQDLARKVPGVSRVVNDIYILQAD
jgi:osmotically-inducible protein OsmY